MGYLVGLMYRLLHIEIIRHLTKKRLDPEYSDPRINEVDVYQFDPSELPGLSETKSDEQVWNFFYEPYYKYRKSKRHNRATKTGYWKRTGKECVIRDKRDKQIGRKRNLAFHKRVCASKEAKTDWVMHEFYIEDRSGYKKDFVFCYIKRNPSYKSDISSPDDSQPSHSLASDSERHGTESTFTEVEYQLQSDCTLISDLANQFAKCCSTMHVEPQLLPNQNLVSNPRNHFARNTSSEELDPQQLTELNAEFNALLVCDLPNHSSAVYAPQCPNNPEHGSYSSTYSNSLGIDSTFWRSRFHSEHEDVLNAQRNFQDKYPYEVTGQTVPADSGTDDIDAFINELLM